MFKSIFSAFRVSYKPGVTSYNNQPDNAQYSGPNLEQNTNADPLCDAKGNQWVRDASDPQAFRLNSQDVPELIFFPESQRWEHFPNFLIPEATSYFIGDDSGLTWPVAAYKIHASADTTPPSAWSATPLYFQIFGDGNASPGAFATFSAPIPRPPESLYLDFGVKTPFNSLDINGGMAFALSTTRDTFTAPAPGAFTFSVNVSWAFYAKNV